MTGAGNAADEQVKLRQLGRVPILHINSSLSTESRSVIGEHGRFTRSLTRPKRVRSTSD